MPQANKRIRETKARIEYAKFLQDTLEEMVVEVKKSTECADLKVGAEDLEAFLLKVLPPPAGSYWARCWSVMVTMMVDAGVLDISVHHTDRHGGADRALCRVMVLVPVSV